MAGAKKTQAVNIFRDAYDVYIGRPGHGEDGYFGNPYTVDEYGREEALAKYKAYFEHRIKTDPEFLRRVLLLRGKRLGCFCKPWSACHGDIIAAWLDQQPEGA
jgi:hypothetical protein